MSRDSTYWLDDPEPAVPQQAWDEEPWEGRAWSDRRWEPRTPSGLDRLTHLILVDGRLVDVWSEPVSGTRWQLDADRLDRERTASVPSSPPTPTHELVLAWLDAAVGGRKQLMALDTRSPVDVDFEPDPDLQPSARELLVDVIDLLDVGARELREPEARALLHHALAAAWATDPDAVLHTGSAERAAAGLCWLVGKANGLFGPGGLVTQGRLKDALGCPTTLATAGRVFQQCVAGFWPRPRRPTYLVPDLLLLGRPELLSTATRRRLVRLRDQALEAAAAAAPVTRSASAEVSP